MSKVLVISTSLRAKSNSDILTEKLIEGAKASGHDVEHISLKGKSIGFCIGCLSCQKTQKCVIKDDAVEIAEKVKNADTIVFATPIYYYEMSGQMKTLWTGSILYILQTISSGMYICSPSQLRMKSLCLKRQKVDSRDGLIVLKRQNSPVPYSVEA